MVCTFIGNEATDTRSLLPIRYLMRVLLALLYVTDSINGDA